MMRSLERGRRHESLEQAIARIAFAYGFGTPPVLLSRKAVAATDGNQRTATATALLKHVQASVGPLQFWGSAKTNHGSTLSFAVVGTKHAIGNALVVKTALSIAELSGFKECAVLVSSVGDLESKKRFTRELLNFFKKNHDAIPQDVRARAAHDPDAAYRELMSRKDSLIERAPRAIDYLSENSRKLLMDTLSFFESVGIAYTIDARLQGEPNVETELIFAIEATEKGGNRVKVATGGRYDSEVKRGSDTTGHLATAVSISIPKRVDVEEAGDAPTCFVVHVGDAAKLKSFVLLESLWKAHITVTQALMAENLRAQIDRGKASGARYLAIIGQREALDGTVIVRNLLTQLQLTMPLSKLEGYVSRVR